MRILVASDLHYRLRHYDWLLNQAAQYDVVALPGDHIDLAGAVPFEAQAVVLGATFGRLGAVTSLLATSGNHDLDGDGDNGEQTAAWLQGARADNVHVDGDVVDHSGVRFTLCPWWDGPLGRDAVDAQLARDAHGRPARWVWLYHSPPAGTGLCRTAWREFPDPDLAGWIERWQPDVVLCGHIHQAPWVEGGAWAARMGKTWAFNAGRQVGSIPAHIVLDLTDSTAEWYGAPDRDERMLEPVQ